MKVALLGYGKMGKTIEEVLLNRAHIVCLRQDGEATSEDVEALKTADIAIDFSVPTSALQNIENCFNVDVPVVVGTTGWYDNFSAVKEKCLNGNRTLFYASNFSIGVNILFDINKQLAKLMNEHEYEVSIEEVHHIQKIDSPSGTAVKLAEDMISQINKLQNWTNMEATDDGELSIISKRIKKVPGTHTIKYSSDVDTLEIRHEAHSRVGFATGAVLAAEWIVGKQGVFTMSDLLKS